MTEKEEKRTSREMYRGDRLMEMAELEVQEQAQQRAALEAHPAWAREEREMLFVGDKALVKVSEKTWEEIEAPVLSVPGEDLEPINYVRIHSKGPKTLKGVMAWYEKQRQE